MRGRQTIWAVLALGMWGANALGEVRLANLFSDHAVLQRRMPVPIWGTAANGEKVTVTLAGQTATTETKNGRWMVRLEPLEAGGPHELVVTASNTLRVADVLIGEVWVCSGQSNMQWSVAQSADPEKTIAQSANPRIRLLTVPRQAAPAPLNEVSAHWELCGPKTVADFTAVGYAFGKALEAKLGVAVGLINTSYGGTPAEAWTSRGTLEANPELAGLIAATASLPPNNPNRASGLFNAMIHPLLPYAIRGAIWYQGESNADRAYQYKTLFPAMITDWRKAWGEGDFPFFFVQLAPFMKIVAEPGDSAWAELREAQRLTARDLPNTAMAVITDLGDEKDIHPKQKAPVGQRLALAARAIAYGETESVDTTVRRKKRGKARVESRAVPITYAGPDFDSLRVDGSRAIVRFKNVDGGLVAKGGKLTGFTIAGADRKFHNAEATIEGDEVVVQSPAVTAPVAVRYGWANYPVVNLWNQAGLPATPFRSDDFPWTTAPKTTPTLRRAR